MSQTISRVRYSVYEPHRQWDPDTGVVLDPPPRVAAPGGVYTLVASEIDLFGVVTLTWSQTEFDG